MSYSVTCKVCSIKDARKFDGQQKDCSWTWPQLPCSLTAAVTAAFHVAHAGSTLPVTSIHFDGFQQVHQSYSSDFGSLSLPGDCADEWPLQVSCWGLWPYIWQQPQRDYPIAQAVYIIERWYRDPMKSVPCPHHLVAPPLCLQRKHAWQIHHNL